MSSPASRLWQSGEPSVSQLGRISAQWNTGPEDGRGLFQTQTLKVTQGFTATRVGQGETLCWKTQATETAV